MRSNLNIISQSSESTVVTEYEPVKAKSDSFQSEAALEKEFIRMLCEQGYEYADIHSEEALIANLRQQLQRLNDYQFSDDEWKRFLTTNIVNPNEGVIEKTRKIQGEKEDNRIAFRLDNGHIKNFTLFEKTNVHANRLQVINQYEVSREDGARYDNRYDVTILVNGLPLVHIELKRRGVPLEEAFNQIERYQRDSFWAGCGLYEYIQIFVISNGTNTKYYSNSTRKNAINERQRATVKPKARTSHSFQFTSFWSDARNRPIPDLVDFTRTFFARHTLLNILAKYCIFTAEEILLVMRPYQITAAEKILNRIEIANNYRQYGDIKGGGYIWHTTGSGKTLTSFKAARQASFLPYIDKVLFVVDRKDLDYQTMKEYDRFEQGAANSNSSTKILQTQLEKDDARIIITTIQKLSTFVKRNPGHAIYSKHVVIIFDECHRSQFGDMHQAIVKNFKKYHIFGFTGTPIFAETAASIQKTLCPTTEQTFGDRLHTYTIVDAINDRNVLPFRVDYIKTMEFDESMEDEEVRDIDRESAFLAPERIRLVTSYILEHFSQKTCRQEKSYQIKRLQHIEGMPLAKSGKARIQKNETRFVRGFNSILAVASVEMAKLYYDEFKRQQAALTPEQRLKVATIYSYGANEALDENTGLLDEENSEDTSALDQSSRDFLENAIQDYNEIFQTNFDTSGDRFQNYYKDVALRMKNRELDLLIVVNMFLTGFDATTLNTLWVDKNLKMHGLIQAFSRTNRILNKIKDFGNIVCFRNLQKRVDDAISIFGDKNAGGIVLLRGFKDYYEGFIDKDGKQISGYVELVQQLKDKFPLDGGIIEGEQRQKDFIMLFGMFLRLRNILAAFDDFNGKELLSERELQNYSSKYQDLRNEWRARKKSSDKEDISDDIVFEIELIARIEINIDRILMLVEKYRDEHGKNKEILVTIQTAVDASPSLRSKKQLIEDFIAQINSTEDVFSSWTNYVERMMQRDLAEVIRNERLNETLARKYMKEAFRAGEFKTLGRGISDMMPKVSRFKGHASKKEQVVQALKHVFDKYIGIEQPDWLEDRYSIEEAGAKMLMAAEPEREYK